MGVCAGLGACAHAGEDAQAKQLADLQVQVKVLNDARQHAEFETHERFDNFEGLLKARLTELRT